MNLRSQSELLKEVILWLTVIVPSAFAEAHSRTDTTGCTLTISGNMASNADASSLSPVFATVAPAMSFTSSVDLAFAGTAFTCSTTAALSLTAEQQFLQLVRGYAATVHSFDDSDMNEVFREEDDYSVDGSDTDVRTLSGTSWFDSILATHTYVANLFVDKPRLAIQAMGLQAGFRLIQWLAVLMLWGIGGVGAWMYFRLGVHQG